MQSPTFFVTTKDAKSTKKEINQKGYKVHKLGVRFMAPSDERNERQKIVPDAKSVMPAYAGIHGGGGEAIDKKTGFPLSRE